MPKFTSREYSLEQNFLKSAHIVAFTKTAEAALGNEDDVVVAGSIYPANDATAEGIVMHDTEVGQPMSVMYEGHVYTDRLPVAPAAEAQTAMKNISFH